MANELSRDDRLRVLSGLVEGNSERAIERMTGIQQKTIGRLALRLGQGAVHLHNSMAHDLQCSLVQVDEAWSFVQKKERRVKAGDREGTGAAFVYVALDKLSRFVISFHVGKRDEANTKVFIEDLRARLIVMPAITSDGFAAYPNAIGTSFGYGIDYAQLIKDFRGTGRKDDDYRYEPPRDPKVTKKVVFGAPNLDASSTSYVERNNGTMRHKIGRMRRLCYAFSKHIENHRAAIALNYVHYNLCSIVKTTRVTPGMAVGVTDHPWDLDELLDALLDAAPCEAPAKQALAHRTPEGPARELPNGAWLRLVGGKDAPAGPAPTPAAPVAAAPVPVAALPAPVAAAPMTAPVPDERGQLDLLSYRPKPRQLSLFGDDPSV